ncbi:hypothetical protein [Celeribacter indicus]|uniref:Lipoprotein n=1 Tax=Celeribacter indicus TaxID=1208324 RepID=A0A0B5E5I9_9RHOB|nr:hypothetical protein [Celeribacter indicus]AJE48266.1 hypothetical protein P73_3551 [Celeribacter indicus]SDW71105.1 hypothetical protein SAMN05443573_10694 [Celeribacter indicus]
MSLRRLGVCAVLFLAACLPVTPRPGPVSGGQGADPAVTASEKRACEARGGEFRSGGMAGFLTCFTTPKDAGKSCKASGDCGTGKCLARSGTCAPITPLFGCNEILDAQGRRVTLCVD